ncbi:decorin-like [Narcine bancroftii]|uniref:decorin-like n=1 Tax=Narcine bancroftii TaxID=1343680 RepID=UPI003831C6B3
MNGAPQVLLSCLVAFLLCQAKPFKQSRRDDLAEEDRGSGGGSVPERHPSLPYACPARCRCHITVVQCSNLGLTKVPARILPDTTLLDLQNNKIRELKEKDFKNLKNLLILILVNNRLRRIHPKAFAPLRNLRRLYLSKNLINAVPDNMPQSLVELHICDNKIKYVKKKPFDGMSNMFALELNRNPLQPKGVARGAFQGLTSLFYLRITETGLSEIPKDLPSSISEIHLDRNRILKVEVDDFKNLSTLTRLRLSSNKIRYFANMTLSHMPNLQDLHLDNNRLFAIPPGLSQHKNIMISLPLIGLICSKIREMVNSERGFGGFEQCYNSAESFESQPRDVEDRCQSLIQVLGSCTSPDLAQLQVDGDLLPWLGLLPGNTNHGAPHFSEYLQPSAFYYKAAMHMRALQQTHRTLSSTKDAQTSNLGVNPMFNLSKPMVNSSSCKTPRALYLNDNQIAHIKSGDFCPLVNDPTKSPYSRISLYGNPIPYWEIEPGVFRCALDWIFIQLERPT